MMINRLFALMAFACLLAFFGVLIAWVPHVDLVAVVLIGLGLAAYDMWLQIGP